MMFLNEKTRRSLQREKFLKARADLLSGVRVGSKTLEQLVKEKKIKKYLTNDKWCLSLEGRG